MSNNLSYLIDSDVLITAKNRYYAFPICPGFWESLLHGYSSGSLHSIDRVKQELLNGSPDDDLVKWVSNSVPNEFFHTCGVSDVVDAFREIMMWSQRHTRFTDAAKAKFASGADGWLVAYCRVYGTTVVTNEQPAPESKKEIKLPDVCDEFSVRYEDTFSMLHRLGAQYRFTP
ncbi:DUF4411 family protein [Pelagicoccus sp. SDUM812003]|uniref:DUF4411 family protein n=1 Tax=Pelagicoccus sp. SDUM812003 TaxID=3041267 RepID=UPI00280DC00A|nr:DUF4411 family protein [Pelagicoccus sp. SDUM812003]MDQ8201488.1 DUF4411 family protein [Pelagicoccus sp. SDUM812003]